MSYFLLPVCAVVFAWWFSTGVILMLARAEGRAGQVGFIAMTLAAVCALGALPTLSGTMTAAGVYGGFAAALIIWGWHELAFLRGVVTGVRQAAMPRGLSGWSRFRAAFETVVHHELALVATLALVWLLGHAGAGHGGENFTVLGVLTVLWAMRISAKLNIFLGVPSAAEDFLPHRLAYLKTYFRISRISPLMPFSIAASCAAAIVLGVAIGDAASGSATVISLTLCLTLVLLGLLEHLMLALPLSETALWRWAMDTAPKHSSSPRATPTAPLVGRRAPASEHI
ncbi:MAG: putative photosynthetic complex assembly protein PuhE [Pseudomonadota bacterium]